MGCNTGDAIEAGARAGAALHLMAHSWGVPTLAVPGEEKHRGVFVERSMPGCLVVNKQGERFVNESCPYPEFQQAMYADQAKRGGAVPAWIVFDAEFRRKYPMGPLLPAEAVPGLGEQVGPARLEVVRGGLAPEEPGHRGQNQS